MFPFYFIVDGNMLKIDNTRKKEKICLEILEALPEWFEIPESRIISELLCNIDMCKKRVP